MWEKRKQPVRLAKKETNKEKIQNWMNRYYGILLCVGIIVMLVLLVSFCFMFMPGTESGLVYNNRTGGILNIVGVMLDANL